MDAAAWIALASVLAALAAGALLWARRKPEMTYRDQFPLLYELRDLLPDPPPDDAFFRNLGPSLAASPGKREAYETIEADLAALDPASWAFLKMEVRPLLTVHHGPRGWQPLMDKLSEAKAYSYLKRDKFTEIAFIPRAKKDGQRTPDLSARSGAAQVLCEVKTINISKDEAKRREQGNVGSTEPRLDDRFFLKLRHDLVEAQAQMRAFNSCTDVIRIAYIVVNYDDWLHEAADLYDVQIADFLKHQNPTPELKIVFEIKRIF